jgi:hypothetical protein
MPEHAQKGRRRIYWVGATMFVALLSSVMLEKWFVSFSYQDHKTAVISILRLQAESIADKIGAYIAAITSQVGWTVQLPRSAGTLDQLRFDALRLLRQVPAITELVQLDSTGKEIGMEPDFPRICLEPRPRQQRQACDFSREFAEAVARKVYYGPVYFRRDSEPHMTLALAGTGRDAA